MTNSSRRNLIVVRAGDSSMHPQWLAGRDRNWDIVVSYYGDNPERYSGQYDALHLYKGSKWQGICNYFMTNENTINEYEYIWLPDDDLFTDTRKINLFFVICKELQFTIAQPALTPYSYYSWSITLQKKWSFARTTNFVEIMAPCFDARYFSLFLDDFSQNTSGWGFEWLWWHRAQSENISRFGIIDRTPVFHTRPVGSAGHGGGLADPSAEMSKLIESFNLTLHKPRSLKTYYNIWQRGFISR